MTPAPSRKPAVNGPAPVRLAAPHPSDVGPIGPPEDPRPEANRGPTLPTGFGRQPEALAARAPGNSPRGRTPEPFNDWTEAAQAGFNLRLWWAARLGRETLWRELAALRWGPARDDPTPGIIIDRPLSEDAVYRKAMFEGADRTDPYAVAERLAIQKAAVMENTVETIWTHDLCYHIMQQGKSHGRDR